VAFNSQKHRLGTIINLTSRQNIESVRMIKNLQGEPIQTVGFTDAQITELILLINDGEVDEEALSIIKSLLLKKRRMLRLRVSQENSI
jgi:hypothetical protein